MFGGLRLGLGLDLVLGLVLELILLGILSLYYYYSSLSRLSCTNDYLAIDSGGNVSD